MKDNSNRKAVHSLNIKDMYSSQHIQQIRKLFLSGRKYTCKQLNLLTGGNDSRKLISNLRNKEGWNIVDCRMPGGCKLYWLAEEGGLDER